MEDQKYILDGHEVVPVDLTTWATWFQKTKTRVVAKTKIPNGEVSTVFLGLNHRFTGNGPPLLFETLVFGGEHADHMERYATWAEAEEGHTRIVAMHAGAVMDS